MSRMRSAHMPPPGCGWRSLCAQRRTRHGPLAHRLNRSPCLSSHKAEVMRSHHSSLAAPPLTTTLSPTLASPAPAAMARPARQASPPKILQHLPLNSLEIPPPRFWREPPARVGYSGLEFGISFIIGRATFICHSHVAFIYWRHPIIPLFRRLFHPSIPSIPTSQ